MGEYKIKDALGKYLIVEPYEKSSVLKTEDTSTVFKVIAVGQDVFVNDVGSESHYNINKDDLIIVPPQSVDRTMMGHKEIFYVRDTDVISTITE